MLKGILDIAAEEFIKLYIDRYLDSQKERLANRLKAWFNELTKHKPVPVPESVPPTPSGWKPPTVSGEICRLPGPFFMSGMVTPQGLMLGTYRPAKLYLYDGTFHEEYARQVESFYMLHMPPDGCPIVSTECPAGICKRYPDGWRSLFGMANNTSLAFDIWPYRDGLLLMTIDRYLGTHIQMFKGDIKGEVWQHLKSHEGSFKQCCTDGQTYWLVGSKDGLPYIEHENGAQVILDSAYQGQEINYASVKNNLFTLGMNNIADVIEHDGNRRNGYVNYFDGKNDIAGIDCRPPWIMQTEIDQVTGYRYAIASIWREDGYPNPELVMSKDGRRPWTKIADIPFPSVQTIDIKDGVMYCYGGKYGEYGAVYAHLMS